MLLVSRRLHCGPNHASKPLRTRRVAHRLHSGSDPLPEPVTTPRPNIEAAITMISGAVLEQFPYEFLGQNLGLCLEGAATVSIIVGVLRSLMKDRYEAEEKEKEKVQKLREVEMRLVKVYNETDSSNSPPVLYTVEQLYELGGGNVPNLVKNLLPGARNVGLTVVLAGDTYTQGRGYSRLPPSTNLRAVLMQAAALVLVVAAATTDI
jgi:hypothetical protein